MTGNKAVITGSDFKRMLNGTYDEFLLEYEKSDTLSKKAGIFPYQKFYKQRSAKARRF